MGCLSKAPSFQKPFQPIKPLCSWKPIFGDKLHGVYIEKFIGALEPRHLKNRWSQQLLYEWNHFSGTNFLGVCRGKVLGVLNPRHSETVSANNACTNGNPFLGTISLGVCVEGVFGALKLRRSEPVSAKECRNLYLIVRRHRIITNRNTDPGWVSYREGCGSQFLVFV